MPAFVSLTCSRADLQKLDQLIARLSPMFAGLGGRLLPGQGPASGFYDPAFQGMAEIRLYRFPDAAAAQEALRHPGFAATEGLRACFEQLEIRLEPQPGG